LRTEAIDMRSTTYLAIALGTLGLAAAALADDNAPSTDSLAQMPPNPVTSPATADKDSAATPAKERRHGRDKQARQSETASTAPAGADAAPASAGAAADAAVQPPAAPKKICHSMDVAGSKIPKRVCATQEEWAAFNTHQREDTQDGLRRLQSQGANSPASPGVSAAQLPP
jgi:hypothetical protein